MKNLTLLLFLCASVALPANAAIKYFTDYPNQPNPPGSYAFPMDTGQHAPGQIPYNYITVADLTAYLSANIGSVGTTNTAIYFATLNTNFTLIIGGNDTNYVNGVSNALFQILATGFLKNNNDNGTNESFWGTTFFDTLTNTFLYAGFFFTGITNAPLVRTDGDGLLQATDFMASTNYVNQVSNQLQQEITASTTSSNVWLQSTKVYLKTNTLNVILGDVSQTPTHLLHIFHTNAANNDVVGIDSTSSASESMLHIKNLTAQGPFFDYESANVRWGFGIGSGGNFILRTGPNAADPVNGSTVTIINTNGEWTVRGITNTGATSLRGVETNTTLVSGVIHADSNGGRTSSAVVDGDISGTLTKNTTGASGSTTNYWDTNSISLAFSWTGPSNTVPVDQGYHFYTTTTGFSFTNMVAVSGSNLWSTVVVSNQLSTSVTGYCTIPGIRIYGVPSVGSASNAVIVPGGKTLVASFWSVSTLITNAAIAAQSN